MFTTSRYLSVLALVALAVSPAIQQAHAQVQTINITSGVNPISGIDRNIRAMALPLGGFTRPTDFQFTGSHINGFAPLTARNAAWANPINGGSWISNIASGSSSNPNSVMYALAFDVTGNFAAMGPRTIDLDYLVDNSLGSVSTNTTGVYIGFGNNSPTAIGTGAQGGSFTSVGHLSFDASSIINQPGTYWLYLVTENGAPGANPQGISFNFYYNASCGSNLPAPSLVVDTDCNGTAAVLAWGNAGFNAVGSSPTSYTIYRSTGATPNFANASAIATVTTTTYTDTAAPAAPTLTWYYVKSNWSGICNVSSVASTGQPYVGYNIAISANCATDGATGRHLTLTTADGVYAIYVNSSNTMTGATQISGLASGPGTWTIPVTTPYNPATPSYYFVRKYTCETGGGVRDVVPSGGVFGSAFPAATTNVCLNQAYNIVTAPVVPQGSTAQFQWLFTPNGSSTEILAQNIPQFGGNAFATTLSFVQAHNNQTGRFRCRMTTTTACGQYVSYSNYSTVSVMSSTNFSNPAAATVCRGNTATFTIGPAVTGLFYQWMKNNATIPTNAPRYSGMATPTLTIQNAAPADAADYTCYVFSTGCGGSTTSSAAHLTVCLADFNCDGGVDFFDYLDFVAAFSSAQSAADFNSDGTIDFFDYLDFVNAFSSGC